MLSSEKAGESGTKPLAIRVSSAGGSPIPLHEALVNIKSLVAGPLNLSPGYESYTRRLLLPLPTEYDTALHDDLSADEAYEIPVRDPKPSNWRKVRNIVQWTPFIQTYKKHKYPWVQLAGHQGNFRAGYKQGTILKKLCPVEEKALESISADILRPYVPRYTGVVEGADGEKYLQLEDLLSNYALPCVMDIKMGVRTYLEDELAKAREKPKLRKDMYEKMIQIDPKAPTEAEQRAKAVTKPRYMVWRETISSTATQGFRIEGVRRGDGTSSKDFKTTRSREQVLSALNSFLQGYPHAASRYVQQLKSIKATLEISPFFKTHELIGSSLLFVHNDTSALVRMIDFAKTIPLPENVHITHQSPWSEGTHEDGYLLGLDNLIDLFSVMEKNLTTNGETSKSVSSSSSDKTNSSTTGTPSTSDKTNSSITVTSSSFDKMKSSSSSLTAISPSINNLSAQAISTKPS
nr:inositol-trisphosphate 3-kinase B-like isoform X2 [Procambarus clarkii]